MILHEQYAMDPSISLFVREHFYAGEVEDASHDFNKQLVDKSKLAPYGFFDITDVDELNIKGKGFVECAVIIFLLQRLCKGNVFSFLVFSKNDLLISYCYLLVWEMVKRRNICHLNSNFQVNVQLAPIYSTDLFMVRFAQQLYVYIYMGLLTFFFRSDK
jgi:hypothetical protein